jgi:hypothetical protein
MWLPSVARLQRQEGSWTKQEHQEARGTGTFPTWFYEALHPMLNFANDFDHADHTANAHKIYWKYCIFRNSWKYNTNLIFIDNGAPFNTFQYTHLTLAMAFLFELPVLSPFSPSFLYYQSTSCWSTMAFVLSITPSCCKGKSNQWQWHFRSSYLCAILTIIFILHALASCCPKIMITLLLAFWLEFS